MRRLTFFGIAAGLIACGGNTDQDSPGGGAGTGGSGASGTGGASGSGASAGTGGGGGSGAVAGSGGLAGQGGAGGVAGACCSTAQDCPQYASPGSKVVCVKGECKEAPAEGTCWSDTDCSGESSVCQGAFVCPCLADCSEPDQLGKCVSDQGGCCKTSEDCPGGAAVAVCVQGNCEPLPPEGKCWDNDDCASGACWGACICPCGQICVCGGQMGECASPPPPPGCCTADAQCPGGVCAQGVCKKPVKDHCWVDSECPAGQKCTGSSVCPCGFACGMLEAPGTCQAV